LDYIVCIVSIQHTSQLVMIERSMREYEIAMDV
jgi:hypothetical protein